MNAGRALARGSSRKGKPPHAAAQHAACAVCPLLCALLHSFTIHLRFSGARRDNSHTLRGQGSGASEGSERASDAPPPAAPANTSASFTRRYWRLKIGVERWVVGRRRGRGGAGRSCSTTPRTQATVTLDRAHSTAPQSPRPNLPASPHTPGGRSLERSSNKARVTSARAVSYSLRSGPCIHPLHPSSPPHPLTQSSSRASLSPTPRSRLHWRAAGTIPSLLRTPVQRARRALGLPAARGRVSPRTRPIARAPASSLSLDPACPPMAPAHSRPADLASQLPYVLAATLAALLLVSFGRSARAIYNASSCAPATHRQQRRAERAARAFAATPARFCLSRLEARVSPASPLGPQTHTHTDPRPTPLTPPQTTQHPNPKNQNSARP